MKRTRVFGWLLVGLCSVATAMPVAAQTTRRGAPDRQGDTIRGFFSGSGSRIGVSIREVREADLAAAKLTRPEGVVIESVQAGTPAERAGFKSGDIVIEYDGEKVRGARHFARLVEETPAGRSTSLSVSRGGTRQTLTVTPEATSASLTLEDLRDGIERRFPDLPLGIGQRAGERRLGLSLMPVSGQLAAHFGVRGGALVSEVVADSPAARAEVKAGDVITAINGRTISSPADVLEQLRSANSGATLDLTLMRDKKEVRAKLRPDDGRRRDDRNRGDSVGI